MRIVVALALYVLVGLIITFTVYLAWFALLWGFSPFALSALYVMEVPCIAVLVLVAIGITRQRKA